eukprot:36659-Prymnesium_polylepis.1
MSKREPMPPDEDAQTIVSVPGRPSPNVSRRQQMVKIMEHFKQAEWSAGLDMLDIWSSMAWFSHDELQELTREHGQEPVRKQREPSGIQPPCGRPTKHTCTQTLCFLAAAPLMQAAWHGQLVVCKLLVWYYGAEPLRQHVICRCVSNLTVGAIGPNRVEKALCGHCARQRKTDGSTKSARDVAAGRVEERAGCREVLAYFDSVEARPRVPDPTHGTRLPFVPTQLEFARKNADEGAHNSYVFKERTSGTEWLFKPQLDMNRVEQVWRAEVEIAALTVCGDRNRMISTCSRVPSHAVLASPACARSSSACAICRRRWYF